MVKIVIIFYMLQGTRRVPTVHTDAFGGIDVNVL